MFVLFVLGCSGDDGSVDDGDGTTDDIVDTDDTDTPPEETGTVVTTGSTGDTSPTGDTGVGPTFDCLTVPSVPIGSSLVPGASAYHGLAFDDTGLLFGSSGSQIVAFDRYGGFSVVAAGLNGMEQFDWAPTGELYVSSGGQVVQVLSTGAQTVVGTNIYAYGIRVGPDGKVYAANSSEIWRIDPIAGTQEIFIPSASGRSPKVMDWSVDHSKMYFGNISGGKVFSVDLDASFNPVSGPVVFATGVGGWHDGLAVDICGNVYVADFNTRSMFRITPAGAVSTLFDPADSDMYGHGIQFGSGIGGWLEDAIYVPQPYNSDTVSEIQIGVPYRTWQGTVLNGP